MKTMLTAAILGLLALPAMGQEGGSESDPRKQEVVNKLNTMRITVDLANVTMEEAIGYLRDFSGLNIIVDAEVYKNQSEDQLKVTLKVKDLLLKSVLKLMLNSRELTAMYKEGVVLVVPKGKVDKAVTLQLYDVRDLLVKIQDFAGPKVELVSPQKGGGGPLTGATFTLEEPRSTITEEFITDMVKQNTGDKSWDENPNASITMLRPEKSRRKLMASSSVVLLKSTFTRMLLSLLTTSCLRWSTASEPPSWASAGRAVNARIAAVSIVFMVTLKLYAARSPISTALVAARRPK